MPHYERTPNNANVNARRTPGLELVQRPPLARVEGGWPLARSSLRPRTRCQPSSGSSDELRAPSPRRAVRVPPRVRRPVSRPTARGPGELARLDAASESPAVGDLSRSDWHSRYAVRATVAAPSFLRASVQANPLRLRSRECVRLWQLRVRLQARRELAGAGAQPSRTSPSDSAAPDKGQPYAYLSRR